MIDEGYIKFDCEWTKTEALENFDYRSLIEARQFLYHHQYIGSYPNGIGYGNISQRILNTQLLISGTATGHLSYLTPQHFSLVEDYDIPHNKVYCRGPIQASSETMSHAAIYESCPEINAVIHIHHLDIWKAIVHKAPTTAAHISYGTTDMAFAIQRLLEKSTARYQEGYFVMSGHEEGIMIFGRTMHEALQRVECLGGCDF